MALDRRRGERQKTLFFGGGADPGAGVRGLPPAAGAAPGAGIGGEVCGAHGGAARPTRLFHRNMHSRIGTDPCQSMSKSGLQASRLGPHVA